MLPEKRKKLIIGAISVVVIIIVVILLGKISSFIKNRNDENTQRNDDYSKMYDYIGVTIDEDNIYKIYGISENDEKYLDVKTFYEVKDMINIDKKTVLYSDAVNELRYDNKKKEFYFYELDEFYNKYDNVKLTHDYMVISDNEKVSYRKYGSDTIEKVEQANEYLVQNNKLYYAIDESIYEYDMTSKKKKMIAMYEKNDNVELVDVSDKFLFYLKNDELNACSLEKFANYDLSQMSFYSISNDGFITLENNTLKNYSISKDTYTFEYNLNGEINSLIYLNNNTFYLSFDDNYVIIDMSSSKVWKNLNNDYIYLMKVKST